MVSSSLTSISLRLANCFNSSRISSVRFSVLNFFFKNSTNSVSAWSYSILLLISNGTLMICFSGKSFSTSTFFLLIIIELDRILFNLNVFVAPFLSHPNLVFFAPQNSIAKSVASGNIEGSITFTILYISIGLFSIGVPVKAINLGTDLTSLLNAFVRFALLFLM